MTVSLLTRRPSWRRAGLLALLVLWASPVRAQLVTDAASMSGPGATPNTPATAPAQPQIVMTREDSGKATVRAVRLLGDFALDGALTEEIYSTVAPLSDFVQSLLDDSTAG